MVDVELNNSLTLGLRFEDLEDARRQIEVLYGVPMRAWSDEARRIYTLDLPEGGEIHLYRNWDLRWEHYHEPKHRDLGVVLYARRLADPLPLEQRLTSVPELRAQFIERRIDGEWFPPREPVRDLDVENWSLFGLMEPVERMPEVAAELGRRLDVPLEPVDSPQYGLYFTTFDHQLRHCTLWTGVGPMWELVQEGDYAEFPLRFAVDDYRDLERLDRVLLEDGIVDAELLERRVGPFEDDDDYEDQDDDEADRDA